MCASGLMRRTFSASEIPSRAAVCMGTEMPISSASLKAADSGLSMARSRQWTACPARRSTAAGEARPKG